MAGIGEASAIISVVQFGFSLATQLKNYYDDFHEAGEDIANLANSLKSVCSNAQELQELIDKDAYEHGFTNHGRLDAQTCCVQTQKLADKLWKMVCKPNKSEFPKGRMIVKDDIEFNKFRINWPLWKPQVEKHKAELNYLDLKIMMVKKDYRVPGLSNEERERVARDMDSLKRAKKRALEDLKDIKKKQKLRRIKKKVQISEEPPDYRSRTPSSAASYRRQSIGSFRPSNIDVDADSDDDIDGYDHLGYDADDDGAGGGLSASILGEIVDRMAPRLREDILAEIEEEKQLQVKSEAIRKMEKAEAIEEYRRSLVEQWKKTQQDADEMKQQLENAFRDDGLDEEKIAQFVKQRQIALVQGDEIAQILHELGVKVPNADMEKSEEGDGNGSESRQSRRRSVFSLLFRRVSSSRTGSRSKRRGRSVQDEATAFDVSDQSMVIRILGRRIFSAVITVDGDLRRVSRVNLPSPWITAILAEQDKRHWWKGASFKETMRIYSRLDLTSRTLAEMYLEDEGVSPNELVLLYARQLDGSISKRRKIMESTLLSAHPWEYFHGRVLLVYEIQNDGGGKVSSKHNSPGPGGLRGNGREVLYQASESSDQSKSTQRSLSPTRPGSNAEDLGGGGEYYGDGIPLNYETSSRVEENLHRIPKHLSIHYRGSSIPTMEYERVRSRSSAGTKRPGSHVETNIRFHGDSKGQIWDHRYGPPQWADSDTRPVFTRMHRKYIEPQTLLFYNIPWEFDRDDENYVIIKRHLDQRESNVLFEHTRILRRYSSGQQYNTRYRRSYDQYELSSASSPIRMTSRSDGKLADYDDYRSPPSQDGFRSRSWYAERSRSHDKPNYHHKPEHMHTETQQDGYVHDDVYGRRSDGRIDDPVGSGNAFASTVWSDTHPGGYRLSSASMRQQREELVEQLADLAVRERTRSRSRSRGSEMANMKERIIQLEQTRRNGRSSSIGQPLEELARMEEELENLRKEKRTLQRSYPSRADSFQSHSNSYFEYPGIDAIVEHGLLSARPARCRSRSVVSPVLRRRPERIGSQEEYPARGILKNGSDRQGSGDSSRLRDDAAVAGDGRSNQGDDTGSDLFSSEMEDSDTSSSNSMSRLHRSSRSADGSLLGLNRQLTESPTSYSSVASGDDYDDNSNDRHTTDSKGGLTESSGVVTCAQTYVAPYAESYVESRVDNGHSNDASLAGGNGPLIEEREVYQHGGIEGPVRTDTDDEGLYHSAAEDLPVPRQASEKGGCFVYSAVGDLREQRVGHGEDKDDRKAEEQCG